MKRFLFSLVLAMGVALPVFAQIPGMGGGGMGSTPGADLNTYLKLFGKNAGFTAQADVRMVDKNNKETMSALMDLAMAENKLRIEMDIANTKNKDLPPGSTDSLKQMGMDQFQVILRPDRSAVHILMPKMQVVYTMPMEKKDIELAEKSTMKTEVLGKETVDGHACVKKRVVIASETGTAQEMTVWTATDLKDFPIKTIQKQDEDTITTRYSKIQQVKPDAAKFEVPAGYDEYKSQTELMQGLMKKALGGGLPADK